MENKDIINDIKDVVEKLRNSEGEKRKLYIPRWLYEKTDKKIISQREAEFNCKIIGV